MSSASGLLGPSSEQLHNSIETIASDALVITRIFAPITAHPERRAWLFVTRITSETPLHQQAALFVAVNLRVFDSPCTASPDCAFEDLSGRCAPATASRDLVRALRRRFSLVFAGLAGCYGTFGAWGLPSSFASIIARGLIVPGVAERLPRRW